MSTERKLRGRRTQQLSTCIKICLFPIPCADQITSNETDKASVLNICENARDAEIQKAQIPGLEMSCQAGISNNFERISFISSSGKNL